jgi:hypothetical protein
MRVTITYLRLKSLWKFFALSQNAMHIVKQLKSTDHIGYKATGFWKDHYTMTLWKSEDDLKVFAKSGAHLAAMQKSGEMAEMIKTLTIDSDHLIDWPTAKSMLEEVKPLRFG